MGTSNGTKAKASVPLVYYNAEGIRNKKWIGGIETKYYLDGNKIIAESSTQKTLRYFYGKDGLVGFTASIPKMGMVDFIYVLDSQGNVSMVYARNSTRNTNFFARYEYDAYGNCTVYDGKGNLRTDDDFIGNINPFRWKSLYYDNETGLYYANGSYYDPKTGFYLDAGQISDMLDNAYSPRSLDRNSPVCHNILELAGNPSTAYTNTELSPDPDYDPTYELPEYLKRQRQSKLMQFYQDLHWGWKLGIAIGLLIGAILFTAFSGGGGIGVLAVLAQVAVGVGVGIAMWAASTWLSGNELTLEGLGNAALDSFLASAAIAFVTSGVSFIKYASRAKSTIVDGVKVQHAQQSDFTPEAWDRIQSLQHRADGSTISSMRDGQLIHKGFMCRYGKEFSVPKVGRLDFFDISKGVIYELKPNNAWSIAKGISQLHRYNAGMGGAYKLILVLY